MFSFLNNIVLFLLTLAQNLLKKSYKKPLYEFKAKYLSTQINGYFTEYSYVEKAVTQSSQNDDLTIVIIPGNPGYVRFYDRYINYLSKSLDHRYNIYAVCHLGHLGYSNRCEQKPISVNILSQQIDHKLGFLDFLKSKHPNTKFVLISHSIGSYIVLNMLQKIGDSGIVAHCFNLFPTIEQMNQVPNHYSANIMTSKAGRFILANCSKILQQIIPKSFIRAIADSFISHNEDQKTKNEDIQDIIESVLDFLDYNTTNNLALMAQEEFKQVRIRQTHLLKKFSKLITMFYGINDGWAPSSLKEQLNKDIPEVSTGLAHPSLQHAFVVGGASAMASISSDWIKKLAIKSQPNQKD